MREVGEAVERHGVEPGRQRLLDLAYLLVSLCDELALQLVELIVHHVRTRNSAHGTPECSPLWESEGRGDMTRRRPASTMERFFGPISSVLVDRPGRSLRMTSAHKTPGSGGEALSVRRSAIGGCVLVSALLSTALSCLSPSPIADGSVTRGPARQRQLSLPAMSELTLAVPRATY